MLREHSKWGGHRTHHPNQNALKVKGDIINNYTTTVGIHRDCSWANQMNVILTTRNKSGRKKIRRRKGVGGRRQSTLSSSNHEETKLLKRKGMSDTGKK